MKKLFIIVLLIKTSTLNAQIFNTANGQIKFLSKAPLEIIKAESKKLHGVLDFSKKVFAFKLNMRTFEGFNSPLQKEHFYENYLEVVEFPDAIFSGKILENLKKGKSTYRAKGNLTIHGVTKEVIIDVDLDIEDHKISFESLFTVSLEDFKIELPMIVHQKIAKEINVNVSGLLSSKI